MTGRIRKAMQSDSDALLELSNQAPLELAETSIIIDWSPSYFERFALFDDWSVLVYENDGRILGCQCLAYYTTKVQGNLTKIALAFGAKTHKDAQGMGIGGELFAAVDREVRDLGMDIRYALLEQQSLALSRLGRPTTGVAQNITMEERTSRSIDDLPHVGYLLVDVSSNASEAPSKDCVVRQAVPGDLEEAARIINQYHGAKDLFTPLSAESLRGRLSRSASYTMSDFFVHLNGEGLITAVGGLWNRGDVMREIRVNRQSSVQEIVDPRAVLDWGVSTDHEGDLLCLVDYLIGVAKLRGSSEMMLALDPTHHALLEERYSVRQEKELLSVRNLRGKNFFPRIPFYFDLVYF